MFQPITPLSSKDLVRHANIVETYLRQGNAVVYEISATTSAVLEGSTVPLGEMFFSDFRDTSPLAIKHFTSPSRRCESPGGEITMMHFVDDGTVLSDTKSVVSTCSSANRSTNVLVTVASRENPAAHRQGCHGELRNDRRRGKMKKKRLPDASTLQASYSWRKKTTRANDVVGEVIEPASPTRVPLAHAQRGSQLQGLQNRTPRVRSPDGDRDGDERLIGIQHELGRVQKDLRQLTCEVRPVCHVPVMTRPTTGVQTDQCFDETRFKHDATERRLSTALCRSDAAPS